MVSSIGLHERLPALAGRTATLSLVLLAALSYLASIPLGWHSDTPLTWDQAHHYLGADQVASGLSHGDGRDLREALLGPDLYPPGHSVLLGTWMALAGSDMRSWLILGLLMHLGIALLLARAHWLAGLAFLFSPLSSSLAPSMMVEPAACLLLAAALTCFPDADRPTWRRSLGFGLLATAVLLTKHNVGLPLLPAALVAAAAVGGRRLLVRTLAAVGLALALWLFFLWAQDDGIAGFLRFARNRANAADQGPLMRLGWYAGVFARDVVPGWPAAVVLLVAPLLGIWRLIGSRRLATPWPAAGRFTLALAYVAMALIALVRHDYLLSRNLVGPSVALLAAAGLAAAGLPRPRLLAAAAAAVLLASLAWAPHTSRAALLEKQFPTSITALTPLSAAITGRFDDAFGRVRVVGTFNEFSPGWVRILARREAPDLAVSIDVPYPLTGTRSGRDARWAPDYDAIVEQWTGDGTGRVIALLVTPDSPFDTADYRHWNAWKANLAVALQRSAAFAEVERQPVAAGVELAVFDRLH